MTQRPIPRDAADNYSPQAIKARQEFLASETESPLEHLTHYSLDPATLPGNIENFFGVAQVPMGSPGRCWSTVSMPRESFSFPWRPRRARSSRRTTGA